MDATDILKASVYLLLSTWLNNLYENKLVTINEENNNVIDFNSFSSSWFFVGKDNESGVPYLGIQQILVPWFIQLGWKNAMVSKAKNRLYISCGDKTTDALTFSFKIRSKRLELLLDKKIDDKEPRKLDIRVVGIKADGSHNIGEEPLAFLPMIVSDDISDLIATPIENLNQEELFYNDMKSRLFAKSNSKQSKDINPKEYDF